MQCYFPILYILLANAADHKHSELGLPPSPARSSRNPVHRRLLYILADILASMRDYEVSE